MNTTSVADSVREAWCAALGMESAAAEDNFFDLGGNSLSAITFMELIESSLNIEFPIQVLFVSNDLAEVTDECERLCSSVASAVGRA
jgi:hypothetical protein